MNRPLRIENDLYARRIRDHESTRDEAGRGCEPFDGGLRVEMPQPDMVDGIPAHVDEQRNAAMPMLYARVRQLTVWLHTEPTHEILPLTKKNIVSLIDSLLGNIIALDTPDLLEAPPDEVQTLPCHRRGQLTRREQFEV
jgi:hypothetical protein